MLRVKHYLFTVLSVLFPCILGIIAMIAQKISVYIWAPNLLAIILLACAVGCAFKWKVVWNYKWVLVVCDFLILLPFLQKGIDNVHRWVRLGAISLNIAMVIMPIAIISIDRLLQKGHRFVALASIILISITLLLQPDASQLTGFTLGIILCLVRCDLP